MTTGEAAAVQPEVRQPITLKNPDLSGKEGDRLRQIAEDTLPGNRSDSLRDLPTSLSDKLNLVSASYDEGRTLPGLIIENKFNGQDILGDVSPEALGDEAIEVLKDAGVNIGDPDVPLEKLITAYVQEVYEVSPTEPIPGGIKGATERIKHVSAEVQKASTEQVKSAVEKIKEWKIAGKSPREILKSLTGTEDETQAHKEYYKDTRLEERPDKRKISNFTRSILEKSMNDLEDQSRHVNGGREGYLDALRQAIEARVEDISPWAYQDYPELVELAEKYGLQQPTEEELREYQTSGRTSADYPALKPKPIQPPVTPFLESDQSSILGESSLNGDSDLPPFLKVAPADSSDKPLPTTAKPVPTYGIDLAQLPVRESDAEPRAPADLAEKPIHPPSDDDALAAMSARVNGNPPSEEVLNTQQDERLMKFKELKQGLNPEDSLLKLDQETIRQLNIDGLENQLKELVALTHDDVSVEILNSFDNLASSVLMNLQETGIWKTGEKFHERQLASVKKALLSEIIALKAKQASEQTLPSTIPAQGESSSKGSADQSGNPSLPSPDLNPMFERLKASSAQHLNSPIDESHQTKTHRVLPDWIDTPEPRDQAAMTATQPARELPEWLLTPEPETSSGAHVAAQELPNWLFLPEREDEIVNAVNEFAKITTENPEYPEKYNYLLEQLVKVPEDKRNEVLKALTELDEKNKTEKFVELKKSLANIWGMEETHDKKGETGTSAQPVNNNPYFERMGTRDTKMSSQVEIDLLNKHLAEVYPEGQPGYIKPEPAPAPTETTASVIPVIKMTEATSSPVKPPQPPTKKRGFWDRLFGR